ncbi:hypothetical protein RhiJN_14217 [Ceratobasidium sp. AG-Ba]|nr:hypothetical protein RhiJN_14217 [Ceratobasidium sp. AG-Ba]QRW14768.1 hypothetical protein RhiLY_13767 [Ceratobasidium sp. AG-Ba]
MNGAQEVSHSPSNGHGTNGISNQAGPSNIYASPAPSSPTDPSRAPAAHPAPELTPEQINQRHADISAHIYHTGFQLGQYADVSLAISIACPDTLSVTVPGPSGASTAGSALATSHNNVIFIRLEDEPHITEEAIAVALGYLYSPYQVGLVNPGNARSVVAAACLLGGMPELAEIAFEYCRASISPSTIVDWVNFIESMPPGAPQDAAAAYPQGQTTVFGPYLTQFRDLVYGYLIVTLPNALHTFASPEQGSGWDELLSVYTQLPFETLKHAIESPAFPASSDQVRFRFAKAVIAQRKQATTGTEESVVLAFGGSESGSAVHVTRKTKKKQLWKVGGR